MWESLCKGSVREEIIHQMWWKVLYSVLTIANSRGFGMASGVKLPIETHNKSIARSI